MHRFPLGRLIAVGLGYAALLRDNVEVYREPIEQSDFDTAGIMTGRDAEKLAYDDPDHDWRIVLTTPQSHIVYRRYDIGQWLVVEQHSTLM